MSYNLYELICIELLLDLQAYLLAHPINITVMERASNENK